MIQKEFEYLKVSKDMEKKHYSIIMEMAKEAQNGVKINLPNNITVHKEYDFITISVRVPKPKLETMKFRLGNFNLLSFGDLTVRKTNKIDLNALNDNCLMIDSEKLPQGCEIRTRRDGDKFCQINGGTKKLKDYFIDKKIPQRLRADIPLLCYEDEVYAIIGYTVSNKVKVDENTKSAYILKIEK